MKSLDSHASDAALRCLVLARVIVGIVVVAAVVLAPPVMDSIATLDASGLLEEAMNGDGELIANKGIDVHQTTAAPVEPLSMSY